MTDKRSTRIPAVLHKGLQGLAALALAGLLAAGCGGAGGGGGAPADTAALKAGPGRPGALSAAQAHAFLAQNEQALVLDVRNPNEWNDDLGHIEGARQIPLPELSARLAELEPYKDKPIVVVCRVGGRSATATAVLSGSGFAEVYNLSGGMRAWRSAGH